MADRSPRRRRRDDVLARLDRIREDGDRSRSFDLLDLLLSGRLGEEATAEVAETLLALEDPRCAPALLRAAQDPRCPFQVRAAAVEILSATPVDDPPRADTRLWAQDHDPVLRALGVQYLDVPEGDAIAAACGDPEPIVRRVAVESLATLVRTPPLVAALRRALRDEDAIVREIACRVALFDEPVEASWELLRALSDPSTAVRAAACDALEWFPRVSVMLALADARSSGGDAGPADVVLSALGRRVIAAFGAASPHARRRLERWAGPVAWLLRDVASRADPAAGDDASAEAPGGGRRAPAVPATDLERVDVALAARALGSDDTPPDVQRALLTRRSWARSGRRGLEILRACATSRNWALRQMSARPLASLRAFDVVETLARDPEPVVRRAAFVAALDAESMGGPAFLAAARDALRDPHVRPTTGDHALALVAALAGPAEVEEIVLDELERPDDRDGLFLGAIHLARLAGLPRAVPALLAIVNAPVVASVAAHVSALQALRSLGHPRSRIDLRHLDPVDHLDVQAELGEWGWRGARWG